MVKGAPFSETELKADFFDKSVDLICVLSPNGSFKVLSNSWSDQLGWTIDEIKSKQFTELLHPGDKDKCSGVFMDLFGGKTEDIEFLETRFLHKNGHYLAFAWSGRYSVEKHLLFASGRNISDDLFVVQQEMQAINDSTALVKFNVDGDIISANENFKMLFGYDDDSIVGKKHADILPYKKGENDKWKYIVEYGKHYSGMFHKLTNCGTHVWVQGAYSPVRDSDGKISRIIFSFLDVTEFEKKSENNVQQIQAIQKSTGVIELNLEGSIISANRKLCDMLNCEQADLTGKQYGALFDEDHINFKEFYDNLLTKVYNGEFELKNCKWKPKMNDDKTLHVQAAHNPIFSAIGTLEKILVYVIDITEAVITAEEVKRVQQELLDFVNTLSVCLHWVDGNGIIIWANQAELDLLGYQKEEYIGMSISDIHADENSFNDILARLKNFENLENYPTVLKTKSGALREVSMSSNVYQKNGKFIHTRCWTVDVTQSRKIEREILKSNEEAIAATRSKSQFLSNMSHEIRTPLNGIISMSATLLEDTNLNEDQKEIVEIVVRSGEILMGIVNNVLDFSKIEAGKVELECLKFTMDTIKDVYFIQEAVARKKGINLTSTLPEISFKLLGDSGRVCQILMNLLNNAIKFTPAGGTVDLSYKIMSETENNVTIKFVITDSGAGMNEETLNKIFKPFVQSDKSTKRIYGGTGLGLCICKSLLDLMGGTIEAESELGKGSIFSVQLTFKKADNSSDITSNDQETFSTNVDYSKILSSLNKGSSWAYILVAEDNVTNQMVIKRLLALLKINCFIVANGQEAIDALRREKFDLVLMDCQMPVMDGFEATAIIRKDPTLTVVKGTENRLPIIALTANVVKEDQERCFAVGMDDYVSKPIRKSVLAEALMNNLYRTNLFYAQIKDFIIECRDFDMPRLKKIDIGLSAIKTLLSSLKNSLLKGRNSTLARKGILQQFKSIGFNGLKEKILGINTIADLDHFSDNLHKMEIIVRGNFVQIE